MKNEVIRLATATAIIAAGFFGRGCNEQQKPPAAPPVPAAPSDFPPEKGDSYVILAEVSQWKQLSPLERIRNLEAKNYASIPDFQPKRELILASAQFYCQETKCKRPAKDITEDVYFLPPEEFLLKVEEELGRRANQWQDVYYRHSVLEITSQNGLIFINRNVLNNTITELKNFPAITDALDGRDFEAVLLKSILFHSFAHANGSQEITNFPPFLLPFSLGTPILIERMKGFRFVTRQADGTETFVGGANEAITELTATYLANRTGKYLSPGGFGSYASGASFIAQLNKRAGISQEEFLLYAGGEFPVGDFFQRWGAIKNPSQPDKQAAIIAFSAIGSHVQGMINPEETQMIINILLNPGSN